MDNNRSRFGVGAFVLLASGVFCKALGALFRLPLTNLLGIEGIGIFQLVFSFYTFALVVTCGGVTSALSKLVSSARACGQIGKVKLFLRRALFTSVGCGLLLGLVFLLLSKQISAFQHVDAQLSYMLFLGLLPLGAGLASLRGFFQGFQNMTPTAVSQILEQIAKFAFGLLFAYIFIKNGVSQGVFGAFLGVVISEAVALAYLLILFLTKKIPYEKTLQQNKMASREFDHVNFMLMLSAAVIPLVSAFDSLVIVPRLMLAGFSNVDATKLFGLQTGVVGAILNFPLIISIAVTTTLLPNVTFELSKGVNGRRTIEKGLKMLLFLILPTTFGIVAISRPLLLLFYDGMTQSLVDTAFNLMLFGAFSVVFTAIMQYLVMLLQALGEFKFILIATVVGGVAKAEISFFLSAVPSVNIYALVIGNLVLYATVCVLALWELKRKIAFAIRFNDIFALLFGTSAMFFAVYTFIECEYFHPSVNILLAVCLGVLTYAVLTIPFSMKIFKFGKAKSLG